MDVNSISGFIRDCKAAFGTTNLYHILEIPVNERKTSIPRDLTLAYRELSKKFHPDKNGEILKFQTLAKVNATISDPNMLNLFYAIREQEEDVDYEKMIIHQNEETLNDKLNNLQTVYTELEKKFAMQSEKIEDLEYNHSQSMKEKIFLENQNNILQKDNESLEFLKKTVSDLMNEKNVIRNRVSLTLSKWTKEKNYLQNQNATLVAEKEILQNTNYEWEEFYSKEYERTKGLEEKNVNLENEKNALLEMNNNLLKENDSLRKSWENNISQLTMEKNTLQNQNDELLKSNVSLRSQSHRSALAKNSLATELKKMKEDMLDLQKEIYEMKKKGFTSRFVDLFLDKSKKALKA